jgi:hypothetical protein
VLIGSNTYHANLPREITGVQPARWRDPIDLAQPAPDDTRPSMKAMGIAYSNSKLAIVYFAHELQRRARTRHKHHGFRAGLHARDRSGTPGRSRRCAHRTPHGTAGLVVGLAALILAAPLLAAVPLPAGTEHEEP